MWLKEYSLAPSQQPLPVLLNKANPIEISLLRDQVSIEEKRIKNREEKKTM